jgi:hypothetical protein
LRIWLLAMHMVRKKFPIVVFEKSIAMLTITKNGLG